MTKALVVFSGGQDSSTCLYFALKHFDEVETIGFEYGQRHSIEMKCRLDVLDAIKRFDPINFKKFIKDKVVDMTSFSSLTDSALTKDAEEYKMNEKNHLPTSFVPGRNLIFLCYAASYAYTIGADTILTGVGQADYSGYPDCRDDTIKSLNKAINLGMESNIKIDTPLMFKDKAQTFKLAYDLGGKEFLDIILKNTHTCYEGVHDNLHDWGYGCGKCPACILRKNGYESFLKLINNN